jgi:RNA 3'-terminal phosphate cyclase-like protein
MPGKTLKFEDGAVQFRQRLVVSLLSHRPVLMRNIRADDLEAPGLAPHEATFLRLLDRMTNGSQIEINATGTQLRFRPGLLVGGRISHECPTNRNVGWYLEGILPLAPFGKEALQLELTGVVTDGLTHLDPSPNSLISSVVPHLFDKFGITDDDDQSAGPPSLQVVKRGAAPLGGGVVRLVCPVVKELPAPLDLTEEGKVKRVRGTAVSCRIPPSSGARVAHSAKGLLHRLLPDIWIHTDAHSSSGGKKSACGPSPGLGVCLTAESTTGIRLSAEYCLDPTKERATELPEDIGTKCAALLLDEVRKGGCVDTSGQSLALLWMCLGPEDVSRIRLGTLSPYTIASLRLYKEAFGVEFKITPDPQTKTVLLSCLGTGFRNMARAST